VIKGQESAGPYGGGVPLHVHNGEAEEFYVLDGMIELTCDTAKGVDRARDFV
jgi:quercetin dioxygenase-like cupin family protein